jgi:hypothetical protein
MNRPAMAVLNVDMTEWTRGCEKAIMSGKQGLPEFFKKLDREVPGL